MKLERHLPDFEILTENQVYNVPEGLTMDEEEEYLNARYGEQDAKLVELGFEETWKDYEAYTIHFFDTPYSYDTVRSTTIANAIECLAIKDGADLVRFENGNIGFVSYYNGNKDGFEILGTSGKLEEIFQNKVKSGIIQLDDYEDADTCYYDFIEDEDNIRTLVEDL